ncbi:MAG: hypothetical protein GY749_44390 [Desulfobacteraceae bacterium]|nr:hypothetical protein [Desulfobacteraceae bacterium]
MHYFISESTLWECSPSESISCFWGKMKDAKKSLTYHSAGGIRASLFNPMPLEGVNALRDFMLDFQKKFA